MVCCSDCHLAEIAVKLSGETPMWPDITCVRRLVLDASRRAPGLAKRRAGDARRGHHQILEGGGACSLEIVEAPMLSASHSSAHHLHRRIPRRHRAVPCSKHEPTGRLPENRQVISL